MDEARVAELGRWRSEALAALEAAKQELADVQKRMNQHEKRLQLFDELLAIEGGSRELAYPGGEPDTLLDICEEIVRANGRPMHIRDLHEALLARGVAIPGRGKEANLIVRLQRSEGRFIRVGRGIYAPTSLKLPEMKPTRISRAAQRRRPRNS